MHSSTTFAQPPFHGFFEEARGGVPETRLLGFFVDSSVFFAPTVGLTVDSWKWVASSNNHSLGKIGKPPDPHFPSNSKLSLLLSLSDPWLLRRSHEEAKKPGFRDTPLDSSKKPRNGHNSETTTCPHAPIAASPSTWLPPRTPGVPRPPVECRGRKAPCP